MVGEMTYEEAYKRFAFDCESGKVFYKVPTLRKRAGEEAGTPDWRGYLSVNVNSKTYQVAHIVWLLHYGELPHELDHIDRNPSNNRFSNLRSVTHIQNVENRSSNKIGYPGISQKNAFGRKPRWQVRSHGEDRKYIGTFASLEEAIAAWKKHFGQ